MMGMKPRADRIVRNDQPPFREAPEGQRPCCKDADAEGRGNISKRNEKKTYPTPPWNRTSSTSTPTSRTPSTTAATVTPQILWNVFKLVSVMIRTRVRPSWTGMDKTAVFPRIAFANPFFVKVLDVWRAGNERGLSTKSREIVGWACTGVSFLGE